MEILNVDCEIEKRMVDQGVSSLPNRVREGGVKRRGVVEAFGS